MHLIFMGQGYQRKLFNFENFPIYDIVRANKETTERKNSSVLLRAVGSNFKPVRPMGIASRCDCEIYILVLVILIFVLRHT